MTDHVWVSDLMGNEASIVAEVRGIFGPEGRAVEGAEIIVSGQPAPSGYGPIKLWDRDNTTEDQHSGYPVNIAKHVPDIFVGCGFWVISKRVAEVLQRFDLGEGTVFPISEGLYLRDETTRIPGEFFSWTAVGDKSAFLPDETPEKRKFGIAGTRWKLPWQMCDGNIAVSRAALQGPDVWLDDGLFKSLFISRPLGDALEAAGLKETLFLYKARVV